MMDAFTAMLEARDPALGRFRVYLLEAGTDLFGTWLVDVTYGRIGTRGRCIKYVVRDEHEARKLVRENLRRRATAKRRIGVAYRLRELIDPQHWCVETHEDSVGWRICWCSHSHQYANIMPSAF